MSPRDQLKLDVALMRELGVTEWNGIRLGPPNPPTARELTPEEHVKKVNEERAHRHDVAFAASTVRPKLVST